MYYLESVGIGKFTTETEMQMPLNMARTDSFNAEYLMTRIGRWPANSLIILCLLQQRRRSEMNLISRPFTAFLRPVQLRVLLR